MKNYLIVFSIFTIIASCSSTKKAAKVKYEVIADDRAKVLKGIINRKLIESDTSFKWFSENMKYGTPDANAVKVFSEKKNQFTMIVFGGTWCHDTQNLLPVFYKLIDQSGYPEKKIELVAVDRKKQTINKLNETYKITNVPTFIILKNGKEVGRVTEYGKTGAIDKELGEIVSTL